MADSASLTTGLFQQGHVMLKGRAAEATIELGCVLIQRSNFACGMHHLEGQNQQWCRASNHANALFFTANRDTARKGFEVQM